MIKIGSNFKYFFIACTLLYCDVSWCKKTDISDPTRPVNLDSFIYVPQLASNVEVSEYSLKKILISKNRNIVVINDQVLQVGDHVGEFVVSEIHRDKAIIVNDAITLELKLLNIKVRSD